MGQTVSDENIGQVKRSYTTLWVMIILFALPYVAATYFYLNQDDIELRPSNYGELVVPLRQVPAISLNTLDNKKFSFDDVKGKWVLLTVGGSNCEQACQKNMYKIRQIRKALGQERGRLERVFMLTDRRRLDSFQQKLANYVGMTVVLAMNEKYASLRASVVGEQWDKQNTADGVYIVDPQGHIMMAYSSDADAEGILKDVRRLLKVSKIG